MLMDVLGLQKADVEEVCLNKTKQGGAVLTIASVLAFQRLPHPGCPIDGYFRIRRI